MSRWWRAAALGVSAGLLLGVACGTAETIVPQQKTCPLYYGGGGVKPPPDGASLCAAGPCNYQTQAGCGAGETCAPYIDNGAGTVTPACRPAGQRQIRESCDDLTDPCAKGLLCIDAVCRKTCCGADYSACDPGESCIRQLHAKLGDQIVEAGVDLCFPVGTCDVLNREECKDEGRICRIVDPTGAVACAPPSNVPLDAVCDTAHQCAAGLHCVGGDPAKGTPGICRRLCRWAPCPDSPICEVGEGPCVHFDRDPEGVGECTPDWKGAPMQLDAGVAVP